MSTPNETTTILCAECGRGLTVPIVGALRAELGHSRVFKVQDRELCETCYPPIAEQIERERVAALRARALGFAQQHLPSACLAGWQGPIVDVIVRAWETAECEC